MVYLGEENASECLSQALQVFKRFWNTVWQRQLPDLEQQTRGCLDVLGPVRPPSSRTALKDVELLVAARGLMPGQKTRSPACHLLLGLASLVSSRLVKILAGHSLAGRKGDCAVHARHMRPICILNCWWRVWASARLKSQDAFLWTSSWCIDEVYGGKQGSGTYPAIGAVVSACENNGLHGLHGLL